MNKEEALAVVLDWTYSAISKQEKKDDNDSEATQQTAGVGKENGEGYINCDSQFSVWDADYKTSRKHPVLRRNRWRAEKDEYYYYVNLCLGIGRTSDQRVDGDDSLYRAGNYFKTREEAERARERVIKAFKGEEQ